MNYGKRSNYLKKSNMIKLFISDVDGVLTDGSMYYSENGDELKRFNTYDGMAFQILLRYLKLGLANGRPYSMIFLSRMKHTL